MIDVLRDEERHRRLFEGFLREFERASEAADPAFGDPGKG